MIDWNDFFERERRRIDEAFASIPCSEHAEKIKEVWEEAREHWPKCQADGQMMVSLDGLTVELVFEQIRYGDTWVIEGEGVIVERLPAQR